jgi:hypothetical protein
MGKKDMNVDDEDEYPGEAMDAAQAFEALQREVALQRRAVEALGDALEARAAPDLTVDIAKVLKGQAQVVAQMERLQNHPALMLTPQEHGRSMAHAGGEVVREAVQALEQASQALRQDHRQLADLVDTARTVRQDKRALAWSAGAVLVIGMLLLPLLMWLMPVGLSSHVAAFMLGQDRWGAGWALLEAASAGSTAQIADAARLVKANEGPLAACREAAIKSKREQRCMVLISTPSLQK